MQVFIIGNIASGKSTLGKLLSKKYGFLLFSIDEIRKKINLAGDLDGEEMSWVTFKKIVQSNDNIIVESTGVSKHFQSLYALSVWPKILVKVDTPVQNCLKNYQKRSLQDSGMVPLPYDFDIKSSLERNKLLLDRIPADLVYDPVGHEYAKPWFLDVLNKMILVK